MPAPLFKPGQSGNPGGQRRVVRETKLLAADESPECIKVLAAIRDDESKDTHARVAAAKIILSYGLGLPVKRVEKTVEHVKRSPRDYSLDELARIAEGAREDGPPEPH